MLNMSNTNIDGRAGVVRYDVDFEARTVTYQGCDGEEYKEDYPAVTVPQL
jgi:uncharacterized protein YbcV (DUF1398 family)